MIGVGLNAPAVAPAILKPLLLVPSCQLVCPGATAPSRVSRMYLSPVRRGLAAQRVEMWSSLDWSGSTAAMYPSFSWLEPWYAPVILLRAWYSTLFMALRFTFFVPAVPEFCTQVKIGLMAPVRRALRALGGRPPPSSFPGVP